MKLHQPVTLSRHVRDAVKRVHWLTAVLSSFVFAGAAAAIMISIQSQADQQVLSSLSPYLATLVESQDRPEILRVLHSAASNRDGALVLVQSGTVLASTRGVSEIDQSFEPPQEGYLRMNRSLYNFDQLISQVTLKSSNGTPLNSMLYLYTHFKPILVVTIKAIFMVLGLGFLAAWISARKIDTSISQALAPLDLLRREIQGLAHPTPGSTATDFESILVIDELETMKQTISKTRADLGNATDRLAEERARAMSARSFKQLIHDLHNPVAALRQWTTLLADTSVDSEIRTEAAETVPRLADQILRQITAAKKHLESEPTTLREADLRACISASLKQMTALIPAQAGKQITLHLPEQPVLAAHDPDLLQRAIQNLLENGLEACRTRVDLSLESEGLHAFIRVSDDGSGIDEQLLSTYLQGQGRSRRANREALGLASANHIVRTHGGKIVYRRGTLGGASFEIRLEAVV